LQVKENLKVKGTVLVVSDEVSVVILQGPFKGQLAHIPTRMVRMFKI
jgi:hypothetical protein